MVKFKLNSKEETEKLAGQLAKLVYPGLVIALIGDLGTGKTTFVRALLHKAGLKEIVNSPTFTLLNIHCDKLKFYHFDLYRLGSIEDIENIGGDELIPSKDGVTLIEWADRVPEILPDKYLKISIKFISEESREFDLESIGETIDLKRIKI